MTKDNKYCTVIYQFLVDVHVHDSKQGTTADLSFCI